MDNIYWSILIKLLVGMIGVLVFLRTTGKTQLAQLTPLDTVNSIILGALIGSIIYMPKSSVWILIFAMCIWTVINFIIRLFLRNNFFNKIIHGEPVLLIKDGKIDLEKLKKNNLGIEPFRAKLREKGINSLMDVDQVLFETDGQFSVIKKNLGVQSYVLVNNGEIAENLLEEAKQTKNWLLEQLNERGLDKVEDLFCVEYTPERGFYIIKQDGQIINNK